MDDVYRSFPDLGRAQVYECLAYEEDHRAEIDALVGRTVERRDPVKILLDHDVPAEIAHLLRFRKSVKL